MRLESALELRDRTLEKFYEADLRESASVRATAASVPPVPERRLAIGARYRGRNDYQIAIRVQRDTGVAMRRARELIASLPDEREADLSILRKVSVPSRNALATSAKGGGNYPGAVCVRPLDIGYSIGHLNGGPGSLGLLADSTHGAVALTNNHVIALANRAKRGDAIYQCGIPDGPPDDDKAIGTLGSYRHIRSVGSNYFDAAYCILDSEIDHNRNLISSNFGALDAGSQLKECLSIDDLTDLVDNMSTGTDISVAKLGRTTGYTSADFTSVSVGVNDLIVDIPGLGNCRFDDNIEIQWPDKETPFTEDGDSGAVLYLERERYPFGLMFANGIVERKGVRTWASFACALKPVFEAYQLDFLS
jgi:hypothetical protein